MDENGFDICNPLELDDEMTIYLAINIDPYIAALETERDRLKAKLKAMKIQLKAWKVLCAPDGPTASAIDAVLAAGQKKK